MGELLHVRPASSAVDAVDGCVGNAKPNSKIAHTDDAPQRLDLANLSFPQLGLLVRLATRRPATRNHVAMVVGVCTEVQMGGIHAASVVAGMENVEPAGFALVGNDPRDAVGRRDPSRLASGGYPALSVSIAAKRSCPLPAPVSASDVGLESLEKLGILGRSQDKLIGMHVGLLGAFVLGAGRSGHAALGPAILPRRVVRVEVREVPKKKGKVKRCSKT